MFVRVNRFTALRPAQLPSPLFITTIKRSPPPPPPAAATLPPPSQTLTSEAAPASPADQSAARPARKNKKQRERTDSRGRTEAMSQAPSAVRPASSTTGERRPRLPCVAYVCVCRCVSLCTRQRWVAEADWPAARGTRVNPARQRHRALPFTASK